MSGEPVRTYTREEIIALRTPNGGYTRATLEHLGVEWPPVKGWLDRYLCQSSVMRMESGPMIAETIALAERTLEALGLRFDEATGQYYYDTTSVKRWILGGGGVSGNCELCDDNAAQGWIDQDGLFDSGVDEAPAHPNCTCTVEYGDKRHRVYV